MTPFTSLDRGSKAPPGNPLPPNPLPLPPPCAHRAAALEKTAFGLHWAGAGELKSLGCSLYMGVWQRLESQARNGAGSGPKWLLGHSGLAGLVLLLS